MSELAEPRERRGYAIEGYVFLGTAVFFGATCALYWFTSYEHAGSIMLLLTAFLGILPGAYLFWWSHNMKPRPEDSDLATLGEGAGSIGAFPSSSIWPFVFGMGSGFTALAFVFGPWPAVLGVAAMGATLIGYTVESRRGGYI